MRDAETSACLVDSLKGMEKRQANLVRGYNVQFSTEVNGLTEAFQQENESTDIQRGR